MSRRSSRFRTALLAGTAAAGAYAGVAAASWWNQRQLPPSVTLPPALNWDSRSLETRWGRTHCYVRPGTGRPIVLLHSVNATASSAEMKPIAHHLAETTDRPLYAVDWLGFGKSDRLDLTYTPRVFARQLYTVLTEEIDTPADLIALSLGCEYAAWVGLQAAPCVRRLVLVSPTGLTAPRRLSALKRLALASASELGAFELLFYRLTRASSLHRFYSRQVFLGDVPQALVDYAATTAHAKGAHYAPRYFLEGRLFVDEVADQIYARLYRPTLLLTPATPGPTIQSFDRLPPLLDKNSRFVTHRSLPGGLMPHWERPAPFFEAVDAFLAGN